MKGVRKRAMRCSCRITRSFAVPSRGEEPALAGSREQGFEYGETSCFTVSASVQGSDALLWGKGDRPMVGVSRISLLHLAGRTLCLPLYGSSRGVRLF